METPKILMHGEPHVGGDGKLYETFESYLKKCHTLGAMIAQAVILGRIPCPEVVVTIPRGGLMVAEIVSKMLGIKGPGVVSHVKSAYDDEHHTGVYSGGQTATPELIRGKSLIVPEDVSDTGGTFKDVIAELQAMEPASIHTAAVYWKGQPEEPDFYVSQVPPDQWIKFPADPAEEFGKKFLSQIRADQQRV